MMRLTFLICLVALSCTEVRKGLGAHSNEEINAILSQLNEADPLFTAKDITFDSIATYAGTRQLDDHLEKFKLKLFFYNGVCRGYFNLPSEDTKNLQVFGSKVDGKWIMKCVTKLNMEEAGGYMILEEKPGMLSGIWSNGHINFEKGTISMQKQDIDYNILAEW